MSRDVRFASPRRLGWFALLLLSLFLAGCVSSPFYYPDRVLYSTPASAGLKFENATKAKKRIRVISADEIAAAAARAAAVESASTAKKAGKAERAKSSVSAPKRSTAKPAAAKLAAAKPAAGSAKAAEA